MSERPSIDLDDQLCFALYAATHEITRTYRPLLDKLGLTYPQYLVMLALWEHDCRPINELAARLRLPAHGLSPLLRRLETSGLVERRTHPTDGRVTLVCLLPQGKQLKAKAYGVAETVACATALDPQAVAELREKLRALTDQLAVNPIPNHQENAS